MFNVVVGIRMGGIFAVPDACKYINEQRGHVIRFAQPHWVDRIRDEITKRPPHALVCHVRPGGRAVRGYIEQPVVLSEMREGEEEDEYANETYDKI